MTYTLIAMFLALPLFAVAACGAREEPSSVPFETSPTSEAEFPLPDCVSENPCIIAHRPAGGLCIQEQIPGCTPCTTTDGKPGSARGEVCCGGCWAGSWCSEEPNANACGAGGGLCEPCNGSQMCVDGKCGWPS